MIEHFLAADEGHSIAGESERNRVSVYHLVTETPLGRSFGISGLGGILRQVFEE